MDLNKVLIIISLFVCYSEAKVRYLVKAVENEAFDLGEGPHWDEKEQVLWHVDVNGHSVCKLKPNTGDVECYKMTDLLTLVHPYPNGKDLLITQRNKILKLNWKTKKTTLLGEVASKLKGKERFNDGKADASGRLWMGTVLEGKDGVVKGKGNLYKWENNKFVKESDKFYLTNGMDWSHDNKKMYVNDSEDRKIYVFDFDLKTGTISNKKALVDCSQNPDFKVNDYPDGLTIDRSGSLWTASYAGGRVIKINAKTGKVEDSVSVPCPLTTSLSFGGPNFQELYVTTAYKNNGPDQRTKYPNCGKVHRIISSDIKSFGGGVMYRPKE